MAKTVIPGAYGAPLDGGDHAVWQTQADLLADGREMLERWCRSTRFAHLYPNGPNFAILFESYQELDRLRAVGRVPKSRWRQRRRLKQLLRRAARRDAVTRTSRIRWRYPAVEITAIARTSIIETALDGVDPDARPLLAARLAGQPAARLEPGIDRARRQRAEQQFRVALTNEALRRPDELLRLPAAIWPLLAGAAPTKRRHPIATLIFITFPLRMAVLVTALLLVSYLGAWVFFNDAVLGRFISTRVSGLLEGELELGSIHWDLPLVADLVTGRPTHVVVRDVSVWEPYESYGGTRRRRTAHAKQLEVSLVLHEIIPWNRIGIPRFVDIPWVLHFPSVTSDQPMWITVREYEDEDDDGTRTTLMSLLDAFTPLNPNPDNKGLSFAVDAATLGSTIVEIDVGGDGGWGTTAQLSWVNFALHFEAPEPHAVVSVLPFSFEVEAMASQGGLHIGSIAVPYENLAIDTLATGKADVPLGDLGFVATVDAAGTPLALDGGLTNVFLGASPATTTDGGVLARSSPMAVSLQASTDDGDGLVEHIVAELQLPHGTVVAEGAAMQARVWGPIDNPQYRLRADPLAVDALGESGWAVDDLLVDLTLTQQPLPERWQFESSAPQSEARRMTVRFDALQGSVVDGGFALESRPDTPSIPPVAIVVIPDRADEPWRLAADIALQGVNPGRLFPADDSVAARLTGTHSGHLAIHELIIPASGTSDLPRLDVTLRDHALVRDRGPADDGLPKRLAATGRVAFDPTTGLDIDDLVISTGGTRLSATGGLNAGLDTLKPTTLALRIDDGRAFARAFALDAYFANLQANLTVSGSLGAPRSPPGRLLLGNLGLFGRPPPLRPNAPNEDREPPTRTTAATIWLERGVLRVRSDDARLFGGRGTVELWVYLFDGTGLASDPKIKGKARISGIRPGPVTGGQVTGLVDVDITLAGRDGEPARIDDLEVSGLVAASELRVAGTTYRGARMLFALGRESLSIERLVLPVHRGVSPFHGPQVTIPVGELVATGSVGLSGDPKLDLAVTARGIPLDVVARLLDVEAPVGGRIDAGTNLVVGGTLARPRVDGTVNLVGLAAGGVVFGGGSLHVQSADYAAAQGLAAHREVRVEGELAAADTGRGALSWTVDAVAAIGPANRDGTAPVDAEVDIEVDRLSLAALVGDPREAGLPPMLHGALEGLGAHITSCGADRAMLSACSGDSAAQALAIDLQLEHAWVSGSTHRGASDADPTTPPCDEATTLCSDTRLDATVHWPIVTLDRAWQLSTGGEHPAKLEVAGSFDLSSGTAAASAGQAACSPPALGTTAAAAPVDATRPQAQLSGTIDLASLAPLLTSYGVSTAEGRIDLDLSVWGHLPEPNIAGRATLASSGPGVSPLALRLGGVAVPLTFSDLDVRVQPGWLTAAGHLEIQGETVSFGSVRGEHTGVGISGACAGSWGVAAEGAVSHELIEAFVGSGTVPRGSISLDRIVATGPSSDGDPLDRLEGTMRLRRQTLTLEVTDAVPAVELTGGRLDFERCRGDVCGPTVSPGSIAVWLGGREAATLRNRGRLTPPADALTARVGTRGRAAAWGVAHLAPDGSRAEGTAIRAVLTDVVYRDDDSRGRPVYEMEVSSEDLLLQGGDPLVLSGAVTADRARYVKDAVQGVDLLALTEEIEALEAPPPAILRGLQFDLRAQTDTPLRVENNIAHRVEADVAIKITGTYDAPEFSGRFDVEPGGTVDIPFLTGTYEIQHGRVTLERDIGDANVDIIALRNEPVYIQNEARQIQLRLAGTVSAITWDCTAEGDVSGAVETTRGCLDYLVLGAGDVQVDQSGVQRLGQGGLANARKSLQVVGHVTELDLGERIEEAAPRYESFVPDVRLRIGQIGPELNIATPPDWFDFDWAHARFGWDYTRGYPGFLLLQSRELSFQLEILDPVTLEFSRDIRSYLNERIIFDPLRQRTLELRFDFSLPSLR